jgi:hypothetical protein
MEILKEVGMSEQVDTTKKIIVNGQEVSKEKLTELNNDPKLKLVKLEENSFKTLERMHG